MNQKLRQQIHACVSPKDNQGIMVGECVELPLVVEGHTEGEIKQKMHNLANGLFELLPERKTEVFNKVITITF